MELFLALADALGNGTEVEERVVAATYLPDAARKVPSRAVLQLLDKMALPVERKRRREDGLQTSKNGRTSRDHTSIEKHWEDIPRRMRGAYVLALEAEHERVRLATLGNYLVAAILFMQIDSIAAISRMDKEFYSRAVDLMLDMVNDETEAVRFHAVKCLDQLATKWKFLNVNRARILIIGNALMDPLAEFRTLVWRLLLYTSVGDANNFNELFNMLVEAVNPAVDDISVIANMFRSLGQTHAESIGP